jgi:hypothetical protein
VPSPEIALSLTPELRSPTFGVDDAVSASRIEAAAARLIRALEDSFRRSSVLDDELSDATRAYVGRLRGDGLPPERVLTSVKGLINGAEKTRTNRDSRVTLVSEVITLCIEEYYRAGADDLLPRDK